MHTTEVGNVHSFSWPAEGDVITETPTEFKSIMKLLLTYLILSVELDYGQFNCLLKCSFD